MLHWFSFAAHCCLRYAWCLASRDLTSRTTTQRRLVWTNTSFTSSSLCLIQHCMTLVIPEHTLSSAGIWVNRFFFAPVSLPQCLLCAVLIKLKKQDGHCAKRTPFISPICLPDKNTTFPDYFCCTVSGWGHMHESEKLWTSSPQNTLKCLISAASPQSNAFWASKILAVGSELCVHRLIAGGRFL